MATTLKDPSFVVPAAFAERFRVFPVGEDFFFVTKSGSVFGWRQPGAKLHRMETIWADAKTPVRAVLVDHDAKKTYVFIPDGKGANTGKVCQLGATIELRPYRREDAKVDGPAVVRDALAYWGVVGAAPRKGEGK